METRRARDAGITIGSFNAGELNSITDVEGVRVGHSTVVSGDGPLHVGHGPVRTGVTVVQPRERLARDEPSFAGYHTLNGNGEMTGLQWVGESGLLTTAIALTNTHSVGVVRDALISAELRGRSDEDLYWSMPVVGETFDGVLNDINGQHVTAEHVYVALSDASNGPVADGSVGGGTGMVCHGFKGGIGTASRLLPEESGGWTVGALVQANYGRREDLRVNGVPIGLAITPAVVPLPELQPADGPGAGSITVILATNAPLLPDQCQRLAQRAGIGLGRMGGGLSNGSGDIFLAFSTGNRGLPRAGSSDQPFTVSADTVPAQRMTPLFEAAADAVEEAILNALLAAGTVTGRDGITAYGLHADTLGWAMEKSRS